MSRVLAAFIAVALAVVPRLASAHDTDVKYVDLVVDGPNVAVTLTVAPITLTEPMKLHAEATPTVAEAASNPDVPSYVAHWLKLTGCRDSAPAARPDDKGKFVLVTWTSTCPSTNELRLDFDAFFAFNQKHAAIIRVTGKDRKPVDAVVRAGESPLIVKATGGHMSLLGWVRSGMDHIYEGRDHISFVLALLLVVMLFRSGTTWDTRPIRATLKSTATVITAFTVAHSISLIAASLGWVHLPSRVVESVIALSIAYTAAENIVHPDVRWRFLLTFGFGLIHGLGFASVLAELLPPTDVVVPLLCFNVGVELGQLTIVAVALPVFYVLSRVIGAWRYRSTVMPVLSSLIFLLGLNWFIARAFGVVLIPWLNM